MSTPPAPQVRRYERATVPVGQSRHRLEHQDAGSSSEGLALSLRAVGHES